MRTPWLMALCVSLAVAATAAAQPEQPPPAPAQTPTPTPTPEKTTERVLTTAASEMPQTFVLWKSEELGAFIRPVIQMASNLVVYVPHSDANPQLADRVSTLMLARFGFEGQLFHYVHFRLVLERNVGFSLVRNGPVGTSVWEGTASLQARESYIQLARWGLSLTGGIVPDPASLDYISVNILDTFGMDPYVRDPLLVSGFNQGQGLLLRYNWKWLTAGISYTGGNPLVSSLAFGFGGDVSALGTLFTAPLRALSNGIPGSDIQMNVISPSLTFEHDVFDVKAAAQIYFVDVNVASSTDHKLRGYNLRATAQLKVLDGRLHFMGTAAYRRNQQINVTDLSMLRNDYEGMVFAGGADFNQGRFGFGGNYYWIRSTLSSNSRLTNQYLNVGGTYWLFPPNVSVGFRYARSMAAQRTNPPQAPPLKATDSFILSLRLLI